MCHTRMNRRPAAFRPVRLLIAIALIAAVAAVPARADDTGLTLPFDGSLTGTRGQTPTTVTGVTFDAGKVGQAAAFDAGDVLEYPSATNIDTQEGTLEFWYKPNWNPGTGRSYMLCLYNGGGGMMFAVDGGPNLRGIFNCWSSEQVQVITNVSSWHAGEWHHIAFTWSSSQLQLRLYLDGALKDTWNLSAPLKSATDPTIHIGSDNGNSDADGRIDEVSISTRAKSAGEILDGYLRTVGLTGLRFSPENLTLWRTWWRSPRLFADTPGGSIELPRDAYPLTSTNSGVGAIRSDNYIVAVEGGTCDINTTFAGLSATMHLTVNTPLLPPQVETVSPYLETPMPGCIWEMPVVSVRFIPTVDGAQVDQNCIGPDGSWVTVPMVRDWVDKFEHRVKFGLEERSRFRGYKRPDAQPSLGYRVVKILTFYEPLPPYMDFQPDEAEHQPDYDQILRRIGAESYVTGQNVKEFWVWGYHQGGIYPVESDMSSPTTGDVSNSYRINDLPVFDRTYTLYGFNFMRTANEALHNHGHQIEAILDHVARRQDGNTDLFWVNFCGWIPGVGMGTGRAGACHWPPNTNVGYDYMNPTLVSSDCEDWTPDNSGARKDVNCDTWGDLVYQWPGDAEWWERKATQFLIYWWQNMPGWDNGIRYGADEEMTNWWKFTGDWDGSIARLVSEGGLHGPRQARMTSLAVTPCSGAPGSTVDLRATLTQRSNGAGVASVSVEFKLDGTIVGSALTSADGLASLAVLLGGMDAGDHPILCQSAGDSAYASSAAAGTLTVAKADTAIATADASGAVYLTVDLTASHLRRTTDGERLSGKSVRFLVDGALVGTAVTDAAGDAVYTYVIPDGVELRTIRVEFAGDAAYNPCSAEAALIVDTTGNRTATKAYTIDRSGIGASAVALRGYLYRKDNSVGIAGKTLSFSIAGTAVGTAVTGSSGSATLSWVIDAGAATRQILVRFAGDDTYGASSATANLVVSTYDTDLMAPDRSGEINETIYLRGYLYRTPGSLPVVGKSVSFRVDGTSVGTATTSSLGRAQLGWVVPDSLSIGAHEYSVVWAGDAGYRSSSASGTLTVNKGVGYLWLASRSIARGGSAYIRAYLRRLPDYAWLPGRTVQFWLDGVALGSGVTDANGMAPRLYTAPAGMTTGAHPMAAEFAGDAKYLKSGSSGTLTVQ